MSSLYQIISKMHCSLRVHGKCGFTVGNAEIPMLKTS